MRAFIYCRVSTGEQATEDHYSLENQEKRARECVKTKKCKIGEIRKDKLSGNIATGQDTRSFSTPSAAAWWTQS
jgi:DNA invertase Pin-like site-specific DNA recombinase